LQHRLKKYRRLAVLTGDALGLFSAKTASSVIRYRPDDVVAVIDWAHAGQDLAELLGWGEGIPIVRDFAAAKAYQPNALLIGLAPIGGQLTPELRQVIRDALEAGVSVISGLHTQLREDAEFAALASRSGAEILDVRDPGPFSTVASGKARRLGVKRVLTVGTDCVVGKMVAALELTFAARQAGLDAEFVATGQTGIMIAGWGIAIDRVISDFAAGAAEWLVQQVADKQVCFIEGQGSIDHPGYGGVALSLLQGCCPDAMVMCHRPDRLSHHDMPDCPVLDIRRQITLCETLAGCVHPARVAAVAVNTAGMAEEQAHRHIERIRRETNLPATDPVRFGPQEVLEAVRAALGI